MSTREQKLRELVDKWRDFELTTGDAGYDCGMETARRQDADELASILAEPVEVSEAMVDRSVEVVLRNCGETLMSIGDLSLGYMREVQRDALKEALKEPGQ